MPTVVREDNDNMTSVLTVTLARNEYETKFQSELENYRKKAHMKGFRKGKTPASVVRKLYGRAVLADVINQMLQEEIYRYLSEEKINILGQPLPSEDQESFDFDPRVLADFVFKFEIGRAPEFEVQGISAEDTFMKYQAEITGEMIDKELENARKRYGSRLLATDNIEENDLLQLRAVELQDDGQMKEDGVESTFNLLVSNIDDEEIRRQFLSCKAGDTLRLNLFNLEKTAGEAYVRKHLLHLEEADERPVGQEFEVTIQEVSRIQPAELDQEFFDKLVGEGEASTEEEVREKIRNSMQAHYDNQAGALLFRDVQERLLEQNKLELPDDFLRRWMKASNEKLSTEMIDRDYERFAQNLRWSMIRGKLVRDFGIEVTQDEIVERFKDRIRGYFGGGMDNEALVESMAMRLMENEKQYEDVYEDVLSDRLYDAIIAQVIIEPQPISVEELQDKLEQARQETEQARNTNAYLDSVLEEE